ncbi:MAG: sigma-70 family RNA polymerase sigma factor [Planctomycetota bacterium]|nr:MAG: sigma-70 family RNA polymerase sigma factor [Planctomycetota bacterium]RLS93522.1 MAG: sigma-70 family RNA polymerase sigma factor [Planctomycetota bacterium]
MDMSDRLNDDCSDLAALDANDQDAGRRLYDRHAAVIFALCREETGLRARQDAEDAVQESFLRAFRMRDRLTDCTGFRPWLYAIARLVCKERRTSRGRERRDIAYGLDASREASRAGTPRMPPQMAQEMIAKQSDAAPSAPLEHRENMTRLGCAIDALPEDVRLALHIFYIEQDPVTVAKRVLGISRAQFYRLVTQARELIAAQLKREDFQL